MEFPDSSTRSKRPHSADANLAEKRTKLTSDTPDVLDEETLMRGTGDEKISPGDHSSSDDGSSDEDMNGKRPKKRNAKGLVTNLPPMDNFSDIFATIIRQGTARLGLDKALTHFGGRPLRVATGCSGTESPILCFQNFSTGKMLAKHRLLLPLIRPSPRSGRQNVELRTRLQCRNSAFQTGLYSAEFQSASPLFEPCRGGQRR